VRIEVVGSALNVDRGALMARVAGGDERAFAELYDGLAPTLYGVVLRIVRDPAQSEEVTQEVFIDLWRQARRFDSCRGGIHGWAVTIARRRAIDRVRSEQSYRERQRHDVGGTAGPTDSSADEVIESLERDQARRALSELSEVQRRALELAFFDGLTHVEIAEVLGVPLGTAKTRIRDGLIRLRAVLADDGWSRKRGRLDDPRRCPASNGGRGEDLAHG
jgi:RNA polymerase sigma-70 factor (ECF subfamily)